MCSSDLGARKGGGLYRQRPGMRQVEFEKNLLRWWTVLVEVFDDLLAYIILIVILVIPSQNVKQPT